MGVISTKKSLVLLEKLSTSSFCRRRLSVVMVRLKMAETLREACTFIEQVPMAPEHLLSGAPGLCAPRGAPHVAVTGGPALAPFIE